MSSPSFASNAVVALTAVLVVVGVDVGIHRLAPYTIFREAEDGLSDLEHSDPTTLVLGSSYVRTFHVLGAELQRRTNERERLVDIPVESGKLSAYAWLVNNRVAELIDARNPDGSSRYPSLKRLVVVTEWWDTCHIATLGNIPGRLWTFRHFARAVLRDGVTPYARNYLQFRLKRLLAESSLMHYRGADAPVKAAAKRVFLGKSVPVHDPAIITRFRAEAIDGVNCENDPAEISALEDILSFAAKRSIEPVILDFPQMPSTQSPEARATTYPRFERMANALAPKYRAKVVDLATICPLHDEDWMSDCDHLSSEGNSKFTRWTLDGPLQFLLQPPGGVQ